MIGVMDYGMGNLRSVQKAFESLGVEACLLTQPGQIQGVDKLVLPGVGAFVDGMEQLRQRGWVEPIKAWIAQGRPFLGICLGMQLLFESSQEDAPAQGEPLGGLAVLPGRVVRFEQPRNGPAIKIPHMGWNTLSWRREDPLFRGLEQGAAVYFVHGYYAQPQEEGRDELVSSEAEYPQGRPFCASIWRGRLWATQFHPEKSQQVGLAMLSNFAAAGQ